MDRHTEGFSSRLDEWPFGLSCCISGRNVISGLGNMIYCTLWGKDFFHFFISFFQLRLSNYCFIFSCIISGFQTLHQLQILSLHSKWIDSFDNRLNIVHKLWHISFLFTSLLVLWKQVLCLYLKTHQNWISKDKTNGFNVLMSLVPFDWHVSLHSIL